MKKLFFPFKNPSGNVILSIFMTWLYVFVVLWVTIPIITLSEAETPERWKSALHIILMVPGFLYFFNVFNLTFSETRKYRFLIFPLLLDLSLILTIKNLKTTPPSLNRFPLS
jgi:hypothetical protein